MESVFPVFVDNISNKAETKDLRRLFAKFGRVTEVTIISHHGFVTFDDPDCAMTSIRKLDQVRLFGQRLKVEASKELDDFMEERRRRRSSRSHSKEHHRSKSRSPRSCAFKTVGKGRKIRIEERPAEPANDLREVIKSKRARYEDIKIEIDASDIDSPDEEDETDETRHEKDEIVEEGIEELVIDNLVNPVESSDLEQLLDVYGPIKKVRLYKNHALVQIECSHEVAQDAINSLDSSIWMDNSIRVEHSKNSKIYEIWAWSSILNKESFIEDVARIASAFGTVHEKKVQDPSCESICIKLACSEQTIVECLTNLNKCKYKEHALRAKFPDNSPQEAQLASRIDNYPIQLVPDTFLPSESIKKVASDKKVKTREIWLWTSAPSAKKSFLSDMESVISQYGKIKAKGWVEDKGFVYVLLESTEKKAARCVAETHGLNYKATKVRARFADGTPEDELYKDPAYSILLRNYDKELILQEEKISQKPSSTERKTTSPPSSSVMVKKSSKPKLIIGPIRDFVIHDAAFIPSIEGKIHTVSNKVVLVAFTVGDALRPRLARLIPGRMYINGKKNFGHLTKEQKFIEWPLALKEVFQLNSKVMMDVRRLNSTEEQEMADLTNEVVSYEVTLLWPTLCAKPIDELVKKNNQPTLKARVIKVWPNWAILQPFVANGENTLVLLPKEDFYTPDVVDTVQSLISHIEVGDTLAVIANPVDYLPMAEKARSLAFFNERTDNLTYEAVLAWPIHSEADPFAVLTKRASSSQKSDLSSVDYLATSMTLTHPLPPESQARYKGWKGRIEELHLPYGGIIRVTEETACQWSLERQKVYFHRSRLFVNGVRLSSNAVLEEELAVGDLVSVDVIMNQDDMTSAYVSGTHAFWVSVSVKVNTVDRGTAIANSLRAENTDPVVYASKVCVGRIVHFKRPENNDFVTSGFAVIDSGPYAGQRIEFEAHQCYLFGYKLSQADLSFIFSSNEQVCISVKDYNSYILDKLWVGPDILTNPYDQDGRMQLHKYLFDHGLEPSTFERLLKGHRPVTRPYIPLQGQVYKGIVKALKVAQEDSPKGPAVRALIEADVGESLFFYAERQEIYAYGHWMGKADLRYILEVNDEICFEIHTLYDKDESNEMARASLVWLGDEKARPQYVGASSKIQMNAQMDAELWKFASSKQMDEKMFRALVEGRLPPKETEAAPNIITEVEAPDGTKVKVDREVLTQAALLQQVKTKFGPDALVKAMLMLVGKENGDTNIEELFKKKD